MRIDIRNLRTSDDVAEFMRWLGESRPVLALDIETSGLAWHRDRIRLCQFGDERSAWVLTYDDWRGVVREALRTYRGPIVGHNVRFDLHFLAHDLGIPTAELGWWRIHDTMLMAHLTDPTEPKGLKPLAARLIDPAAVAGQQELDDDMRRGKWDWASVPIDLPSYRFYAGLDTSLTAILYGKLMPHMERKYADAYRLEQVCQHPLFAMERHGMLLDADYTRHCREELDCTAQDVERSIEERWGVSVGSLDQIASAMLADGWEPTELTPTGKPSLRADVMEQIDHPLARDVIRWRLANKASQTWLRNFLDTADPETQRVYPNIRQVAARTGRMSITDPPLQTLPRESDAAARGLPSIRNCFVAPEGSSLISADFSGIEARLFAHFAAEPDMLRTIHEGGDLHALVAAAAYQVPIDSVTKAQRQIAKAVNFASLYGAGPAKVALTAGISEDESRDFFDRRDVAFPGIRRFQRAITNRADEQRQQGERANVRTHIGSRISIKDDEPTYRLVNYLIQGSAAVVLKDRIVSLHNAGLTDLMLLPIHDEVVFEVPDDSVSDAYDVIASAMPDSSTFSVPLAVDISEPVHSWGMAK
jgi:DNA polymerase-1